MSGSALYEGTVAHRRVDPAHAFTFPVALPCLDLDEVDEVVSRSSLWSQERPNLVSYRRRDLLGPEGTSVADAARAVVAERLGDAPGGPVRVLGHLRTWGHRFNPLALYLCSGRDGMTRAAVLEVTNTPWHERHTYVVDPQAGEVRFAKELHVSPFFGMDHEYRCSLLDDGERLDLRLDLLASGRPVFEARLDLRRRPLDRAAMRRVALDPRVGPLAGSARIYREALRLRRAGATFHTHPRRARPA